MTENVQDIEKNEKILAYDEKAGHNHTLTGEEIFQKKVE
jgi:hypothetical protein